MTPLAIQRRVVLPIPLLAALAAAGGGLAAGWLVQQRGAAQTLALLALPVVVVALLRSVWVAYAGVLAVVCLLPYATPPLHAVITPTLLELALLTAYALLGVTLLLDRRSRLRVGGPLTLWLLLLGVTAFAFLLGLGRGYTTATAHDYGKFVLAVGMFWLTLQLVGRLADAELLLKLLLAGVTLAACGALALYAGGAGFTLRALAHLVPYGYPAARIVRYIEDDPAKPMRAVGTSVDPNSFGGLLMVGFVLAVGQCLARRRCVPLWAAGGAAAACGAALLLTYSRGGWVGAFVGAGLVVLARRPRWVAPLALLGVAGLALGVGASFVHRLWLGFTLQDPATKLRISEYRNAWAIIRQHPWFGVGFGSAPVINQQTGVSSIYFTIAEVAGLLGLLTFLLVAGVILWRALRAYWPAREGARAELLLGFGAAFIACLTVGLVDHYFFNPQFPHMAALLWTLAGALVALTHPAFGAEPGGSTLPATTTMDLATRKGRATT